MTELKIGDKAPEFSGKTLILYFYPRDNTPGCTSEACSLRDDYKKLKKKGFEVVGVSPDSEESHKKFTRKFNLPFNLTAQNRIRKKFPLDGLGTGRDVQIRVEHNDLDKKINYLGYSIAAFLTPLELN